MFGVIGLVSFITAMNIDIIKECARQCDCQISDQGIVIGLILASKASPGHFFVIS